MTEPRPRVVVIGASHHATPVSIRERLSIAPERMESFYQALKDVPGTSEIVVLSTCNRLEVYGVLDNLMAEREVEAAICEFQDFPSQEFLEHRYVLRNGEMLSHLLSVAAGVDSQIVGEAEIFGQVKNAYATAVKTESAGSILNRVFQKCFQSAKYIRSNTTIGEGRISVATVATDLAQKIFGDITCCRVLVLGTGEVGRKTAKALASRGAGSITVLSRDLDRARTLAESIGAEAGTMDEIETVLSNHDIVVGSTTSAQPVITDSMVQAFMRKRRLRPLFLIDLGMPRNFDPSISQLESVFVYDLDDLARIADENLAARHTAIENCRNIANHRADRIWQGVEQRLFSRFETLRAQVLDTQEQTP